MDININKFLENIDALIITSNPDEVSPKKIRKCLEALYGIDLNSRRKELNKLVINRFNELTDHPKVLIPLHEWESIHKEIEQLRQEVSNKDKVLRINKNTSNDKHKSSDRKVTKSNKSKKRKKKGSNTNDMAVREDGTKKRGICWEDLGLSDELKHIIGDQPRPRTQVVKDIWSYIKEHNLQDPDNKKEIICDDKLRPIFGDKISMFKMHGKLSKHLTKVEDNHFEDDRNISEEKQALEKKMTV